MKTIIALIIASSLIAQNQIVNPYSQALGIQLPSNIVIVPPVQNEANAQMYLQFQMHQQAVNAEINQALANQALTQANPNYIPRDYIQEQKLLEALLNNR